MHVGDLKPIYGPIKLVAGQAMRGGHIHPTAQCRHLDQANITTRSFGNGWMLALHEIGEFALR